MYEKKWNLKRLILPTLLSALIGSMIAQIIGIPSAAVSRKLDTEKTAYQSKIQLAKDINADFAKYDNNQNRLIMLYLQEIDKHRGYTLDKEFLDYKENDEISRNAAHDNLDADLNNVDLFFSRNAEQEAQDYEKWDNSFIGKNMDQLPSFDERKKHEEMVIQALRKELR